MHGNPQHAGRACNTGALPQRWRLSARLSDRMDWAACFPYTTGPRGAMITRLLLKALQRQPRHSLLILQNKPEYLSAFSAVCLLQKSMPTPSPLQASSSARGPPAAAHDGRGHPASPAPPALLAAPPPLQHRRWLLTPARHHGQHHLQLSRQCCLPASINTCRSGVRPALYICTH